MHIVLMTVTLQGDTFDAASNDVCHMPPGAEVPYRIGARRITPASCMRNATGKRCVRVASPRH